MITFLAWLTVLAPFALFGWLVWWLVKKIPPAQPYEHKPVWTQPMWQSTESKTTTYAHTDPPAGHVEPETTITTTCPEVTSIDTKGFNRIDDENVVDCRKLVDPGARVYRTYRSVDGVQWSECDPALTERAAINYASYIKRSNPEDYVRCNDPNGVILLYE